MSKSISETSKSKRRRPLARIFDEGILFLPVKRILIRITIAFVVVFVAIGKSHAQTTILVPADAPTIQAGIDAVANGGIVSVAPGTYIENIDFRGKSISVTSTDGAASTIIDGGSNGVVVTFKTGENRQAVLNGFTIRNGGLPANPSVTATSDGIFVQLADPTIINNIITDNRGYGIEVLAGAPKIQGNIIRNTTTRLDPSGDFGCDYDDGSGIAFGATPLWQYDIPLVEGNLIENNEAHCGGGGIRLDAAPNPEIVNNQILYNRTLSGDGGGIFMVNGSQVWIVQNVIAGNTAADAGGGVYLLSEGTPASSLIPVDSYIANNTIVGNTISGNPSLGADYFDGSQLAFDGYTNETGLFNNLIISGDNFNAIWCNPEDAYLNQFPPTIDGSDVFSLTGKEFGGSCTAQTGMSTEVYNYISADPAFVIEGSEAFHLSPGSPALAVGNPADPLMPATDLDGVPRTQVNISGVTVVDMGVYEGAVSVSNSAKPSFTLQVSPAAIVLKRAASFLVSGTTNVQIRTSNGFLGAVSLQCTGLPNMASCFFDEINLPSAGDNRTLTTTLLIEDYSGTAELRKAGVSRGVQSSALRSIATSFLLICPFGVGWLGRRRRGLPKSISNLTMFVALLLFAAWSAMGCGGNGGTSTGDGGVIGGGNQAPTSYSVKVVATSVGNVQLTQSVTVAYTIAN